MLATEVKLASNNLDVILAVLDALETIRGKTGYGTIEIEVQDGIALHERIVLKRKLT